MDALISFFALRPTFTFLGLRVVWYIYLFNMLVQTYIAVSTIFRALAQKGISWEAWSPNFIPLTLGIVVQLALVRIFLEVAAIIISNWQSPKAAVTAFAKSCRPGLLTRPRVAKAEPS